MLLYIVGAYDHTVKMWDTRTTDCAISVNHGHPVESVLMFPSGGIFLSAGIISPFFFSKICKKELV